MGDGKKTSVQERKYMVSKRGIDMLEEWVREDREERWEKI